MLSGMSGLDALLYGAAAAGIAFAAVILLMPRVIRSLAKAGSVVKDYHKPSRPAVPRPGGPVLMVGIAIAEIIVYLYTMNIAVVAVLLTTTIAFAVGYVDDIRVMPGWFKPVALLAAAVPLVIFQGHSDTLNLVFGAVTIPLLYIPLIFVVIPIAGNTINSIDVLNGVASGFVIISLIPLIASIALFGNAPIFIASLPLVGASVAFYKFHKYPSRIFPGDSGTLLMGAMYGALAVAGRSEIIGVVALLPAVMNSFLFLASVKRIVEHRQVIRPIVLLENYRLAASKEKGAPATLVRMILADGPLGEKEIGTKIFKLAIFSALLAFVTIFIQYVSVGGGR